MPTLGDIVKALAITVGVAVFVNLLPVIVTIVSWILGLALLLGLALAFLVIIAAFVS